MKVLSDSEHLEAVQIKHVVEMIILVVCMLLYITNYVLCILLE